MKDREVRYTVRLYDIDTIEQLQKILDNDIKEYGNKNKLLTEIIRIGLQGYNKKDSENTTNDTYLIAQPLIELKNIILKFCKDLQTEIKQGSQMLPCTNHMLNNKTVEQVSEELLDNGFYDNTPLMLDDVI